MKKKIISTILFITLALATTPMFAYDPPPPPPGGGQNGDQEPPGGGSAPIEGGMAIFVGLAAGYGLWKKRKDNPRSPVGKPQNRGLVNQL